MNTSDSSFIYRFICRAMQIQRFVIFDLSHLGTHFVLVLYL